MNLDYLNRWSEKQVLLKKAELPVLEQYYDGLGDDDEIEVFLVASLGKEIEDTEISEAWIVLEDLKCVEVTSALIKSEGAQKCWEALTDLWCESQGDYIDYVYEQWKDSQC